VRRDDGRVVLDVSDDGEGFDPAAISAGAGLRGMRERAVLIGADLEVASRPGEGTSVTLRLP
jgi:two-component system sensor histidine kinase UhpB